MKDWHPKYHVFIAQQEASLDSAFIKILDETLKNVHGIIRCETLGLVHYHVIVNTLFAEDKKMDNIQYLVRSIAVLTPSESFDGNSCGCKGQNEAEPSIILLRLQKEENKQQGQFVDFVLLHQDFVNSSNNIALQNRYMLLILKSIDSEVGPDHKKYLNESINSACGEMRWNLEA